VRNPRLSSAAISDLRNIQAYSRQHFGIDKARSYAGDLRAAVAILGTRPLIGRSEADLGDGARSFPCGSHRIYYRVGDAVIDVLRVLHQSQDASAVFTELQ
jgi:toxin ParE1/3/4